MSWLSKIVDKPVQTVENIVKTIAVAVDLASGEVTTLGALVALGKKFIPTEDFAVITADVQTVTTAADALHGADPGNAMIAGLDKIVDEINVAVTGVEPVATAEAA